MEKEKALAPEDRGIVLKIWVEVAQREEKACRCTELELKLCAENIF